MILLLSAAALVTAYLANRVLLQYMRENAVRYGAPVLEELMKTLPAYFLNRPVFYVHLSFGLGEALYDFLTGSRQSGRWAAVVSVASHTFFGGVVVLMLTLTANIYLALAVSIACHLAWNNAVMGYGRYRR